MSGFSRTRGLLQQPDRAVERGRAKVHIALRHRQVHVPGELLDCSCGRSTHRQMRAERVTEEAKYAQTINVRADLGGVGWEVIACQAI